MLSHTDPSQTAPDGCAKAAAGGLDPAPAGWHKRLEASGPVSAPQVARAAVVVLAGEMLAALGQKVAPST